MSTTGDDYSYDLVHDGVPDSRRRDAVAPRPQAESSPTPDQDQGGDYSYDLAHEVPPSRPR